MTTKVKKPRAAKSGLIGMFLHTFKEGRLHYQAQVIGVDGEMVLAQMFSAGTGEPTNVKGFERAFIYSDQCKLYADHELWIFAAEQAHRRDAPYYKKLVDGCFEKINAQRSKAAPATGTPPEGPTHDP